MRHGVAGRKFSRPTGHRLALYRNLVTSFLRSEKVVTTETKAKEIGGMAEKMITLGKDGGLSARRKALEFILDEKVVDKLFTELGPRYKERAGGYTRLTKVNSRLGDGADMASLELV